MNQCELGKVYTDKITGFKGTAVNRTSYLEGCERVGLQAKMNKDGNVPEVEYFDEPQLIEQTTRKPGGPRPAPKRNADPTRR